MGPLVDTGVLIDYFGGVRNAETDLLDDLLENGPPPATTPIVVQEFLQGFMRQKDVGRARLCLEPFDHLDPPDYHLHVKAAELHVALKRKGLTTSSADALIVASARAAGRPLLTRDKAQRALADQVGVEVYGRRG